MIKPIGTQFKEHYTSWGVSNHSYPEDATHDYREIEVTLEVVGHKKLNDEMVNVVKEVDRIIK
jgi:hypothetical protein